MFQLKHYIIQILQNLFIHNGYNIMAVLVINYNTKLKNITYNPCKTICINQFLFFSLVCFKLRYVSLSNFPSRSVSVSETLK